jgi:hypothetical protein
MLWHVAPDPLSSRPFPSRRNKPIALVIPSKDGIRHASNLAHSKVKASDLNFYRTKLSQ